MPTIHLLTWNLDKREAALAAFVRHAVSRANRGEQFIMAVQECADDAATVADRVQKQGGAAVHAIGNGTMSILCSTPLEPPQVPCDKVGQRLVLTRTSMAGQRFAVVNYHGMAQGLNGSPHPEERGGIASEARWRIDEHAGKDPVIVLGDFNVEPTATEVESVFCFSFAPNPAPGSDCSHNRKRRALRVAPPVVAPGKGTYLLTSTTLGNRWRTFDFLAADHGLAIVTQALTELDGAPLTDGTRPTASDHLPVAGTMDLV